MHWHTRFKRWLDQWLARAPRAEPDEPDVKSELADPARVVEALKSHPSAVWTPAPLDAETRPPAPTARRHERPRLAASPPRRSSQRPSRRSLRLALQGGGAHGAFTWGVLDRLLDEDDLAFPAISGASAGALNGAMLVCGFADGERIGAQKALARLWDGVAGIGALFAPLQTQQKLVTDFGLVHAEMMQAMMRMWSPAQLNPFNLNPLRKLLESLVDVDALRARDALRLHVAATNVETGQPRIFSGSDLSIDALLASACLPFLNHAVTIDDVAYWDGGYSANPPLAPLIEDEGADEDADVREILLVQINPERRPATPLSATDIMHRVNEITFNASLLAELRVIEAMQRRAADGDGTGVRSPLHLHRIALHDEVVDATAASAGSLDGAFHRQLRDHGRSAAERWLASARQRVGARDNLAQRP
ncbi:MAG: patatin-like phospholipase family protein [Burkholderiaceae bacterium]